MRRDFVRRLQRRTHMTAEIREVMNIREASAYLGVSTESLYRYIREERIPAFKLGNRWRFKKSVLDRWMEKQSTHREKGAGRKRRGGFEEKSPCVL